MNEEQKKSETGCCDKFNPEPWNEKEVVFDNRKFVKDRVMSIFHIPMNFSAVMKRNMDKIDKESALSAEPIILSDENSLWGSDLYISVTKDVPDHSIVKGNPAEVVLTMNF